MTKDDEAREKRIEELSLQLDKCKTNQEQIDIWNEMQELILNRTPEAVRELEKLKGLL